MKELIPLISKPSRYLGREINSVKKDLSKVKLKFCLAFPDVYEVGMSHLGIQILYSLLNQRKEIACERAFAPWIDMEKLLRQRGTPLCSVESSLPLKEFDIIGFSLQYELSFTNVLNMLELSHIPFFSKDRDERFPLVIAGGPTVFNPLPIADFFDAFVIGDGEEVTLELADLVIQWKSSVGKKDEILKSLSQIKGIYVPSLHRGESIQKRLLSDLHRAPFPTCPIVPYMRVVHDRLNLEIARGCKRGCRFCEAGFIYRPYRERSPETLKEILSQSLHKTGYEEFSLLSLSAGDYSSITILLSDLMDHYELEKIAVSLPSLRIESIVGHLAEEIKRVRKTGLTLAPEAATERLRRIINKAMDEDLLIQGLEGLFSKGWRNVKLYFMIGLPNERDEDLEAILALSHKLVLLGERQKISPHISVSISPFVPKPHTPFQWTSQLSLEEMEEKIQFLKKGLKRNIRLKWQDPHLSFLEAVFSRGDRKLGQVLVEAHRSGCRFDGWSDQFRFDHWRKAFEKTGINPEEYRQSKDLKEPLPWSFIDIGVNTLFLWEEYQKGLREEWSPPCGGKDCLRCGVCNGKEITVKEGPYGEKEVLDTLKPLWKRVDPKRSIRRKFRLKFAKKGELRFLSHLELAHLFHRAARRANLTLCYSEGFHPMPRIVFEKALPVGVESYGEKVDLELAGRLSSEELKERLNRALPEGIEILEVKELPLSLPSSSALHRATYWIPLNHLISKEELCLMIEKIWNQEELFIIQKRKGKKRKLDILPLIEKMGVKEDQGAGFGLELVLRSSGGKMAKPHEVLEALLGLKGEALAQCNIIKLE
ncbi:MAG: TIGR03960 family B12-binding radical SAM protein [Thermodesulfobacteriota bacterium]